MATKSTSEVATSGAAVVLLTLSVGQFLQNPAATNGSGTQRLFNNVGGTVYYAAANNTDRTPPTIRRTDAVNQEGSPPQFDVVANDDVGLLRVVVLSTLRVPVSPW